MKIIPLTENTSIDDNLIPEHGLSLYIETKKHKILFDMGQSDLFIKNAEKQNIDLKNVDIAFISHGHYDHGGGLYYFLKINEKANIYINKDAFLPHYRSDGKNIGLDSSFKNNKRIIMTEDETFIDEELFFFTGNKLKRNHYFDTFGICEKIDDKYFPDKFLHESYLLIKEDKNVLISGCSHKGILNILDFSKDYNIDYVIGGFHFKKLDVLNNKDKIYLKDTGKKLSNYNMIFYTCHCTGYEQYEFLKTIMKDKLHYLSLGKLLII